MRLNSGTAIDQQGATTVEAAITIFPTMLLIFGLIQLSLFALNLTGLQYSLNKAGRWGSIGGSDAGLTREQSIAERVKVVAQSLSLDTSDVNIKICPAIDPSCATPSAGGSGQYFVISATKSPGTIFGLGSLPISARVLVKNEPF